MSVILPVASGREVAAVGRRFLRTRRLRAVGVLLLFVLHACALAAPPVLIGLLVDRVRAGDDRLGWIFAGLVATAIAGGVLDWQAQWRTARLVEPALATLRERFVAAVTRLPQQQLDEAGGGDVIGRASDDIQVLSESTSSVLARTVSTCVTLVVVAFGLAALDWRFLVCLVVVAPMLWLTTRWYLRVGPPTYGGERQAQARRARGVLDALRAGRTVRAFGLEQQQIDGVREASWTHVRWEMRVRIVQNILLSRVTTTEMVGLLTVLAVAAWAAMSGASAGAVTGGVLLFMRIMEPIAELLFVTDEWQSMLTAFGRVLGVVEGGTLSTDLIGVHGDSSEVDRASVRSWGNVSQASDCVVGEVPGGVSGTHSGVMSVDGLAPALVQTRGVGVTYDGRHEVLTDVDLDLVRGRHVALVGPSGSGKSTLATLVAGELAPSRGARTAGVSRERIATVTQENHLMRATLRDNLTLVKPDATDDDLVRAVRDVGANALLAGCPDGLDTLLGAGGFDLDPATAQLLALTRLHLADPELVILDEATAEAGVADARQVEQAAAAVIRGRAALVVAHRLSQAEACDEIVVLDGGRVVERGAPSELRARGGRYAELWAVWQQGRADA